MDFYFVLELLLPMKVAVNEEGFRLKDSGTHFGSLESTQWSAYV